MAGDSVEYYIIHSLLSGDGNRVQSSSSDLLLWQQHLNHLAFRGTCTFNRVDKKELICWRYCLSVPQHLLLSPLWLPCLDDDKLNMRPMQRRIIIIIAINIVNASLFNIFCEFILQLITIPQRLTFCIFIFYSLLLVPHQSPVTSQSQCVIVWPKGIWG